MAKKNGYPWPSRVHNKGGKRNGGVGVGTLRLLTETAFRPHKVGRGGGPGPHRSIKFGVATEAQGALHQHEKQ